MVSSKKGKHDDHGKHDERWLITYADMITLLMVFFIVLYSMANTDLKKFSEVAESMQVAFNVMGLRPGNLLGGPHPETSKRPPAAAIWQNLSPQQRDFMKVSSDLSAFAAEAGLEGDISVNVNVEGIIISLSNELVFEPGSAELKPESRETLQQVAQILNVIDNPVRVEGHTDNIPTNNPLYPTNWELSVARAVTIVRTLVEEEGIAPERLVAAGHAEFDPVASNTTRTNRALNRRADIIIIYPNASRRFSLTTVAQQ